ncbi:MAG: shikimate dehydrogenase [Clostridium sp.]|uniref:shikimate dehydrogenase n=1 Tax=Clostridium sp. TaxID=1506 RepID=UPI0030317AF4
MEFLGLLGEKLHHSLSPEIHSLIFKDLKKQDSYRLFEVEKGNLNKFIDSVKLLKVKGFNITIPYKKDIMEYLDYISPEAKKIDAVNTVINIDGKLKGYNTDYYGFGMLLENNDIKVKDKVCTVLGYGGACKAVLHYLIDSEAKIIYIVTRDPKKIDLSEYDNVRVISYDELKDIKGDVVINSTPVGMYPNVGVSPISKDIVSNYDALVDLIYNPEKTEFLNLGESMGKKSINGLLMLVGQAVKAEEIWNDVKIKEECIDTIYNKLKEKF